jgi:hypothetical protein
VRIPGLEFFVMRDGAKWRVRLEISLHDTCVQVIEAAVEAAHTAGKSGIPARVRHAQRRRQLAARLDLRDGPLSAWSDGDWSA